MEAESGHVSPTRTELLNRRRAAVLASQGRDVLADKRTALVRALQERSEELVRRITAARGTAAEARIRLDDAVSALGPAGVLSASHAAASTVGVSVTAQTIAGVVIVDVQSGDVERASLDRGYAGITSHPALDAAAAAYEREVADLLGLAALELTVRRLAAEIAKTTRQVNALEFVVVPRLEAEATRIAMALDEREREEAARLRRARERASASRAKGAVRASPSFPDFPDSSEGAAS